MGFALLLFILMVLSYRRVKNIKLFIIAIGFFIFFIKGLILVIGIGVESIYEIFNVTMEIIILDFIILLLLYGGLVKK
jgi:hypothetical protein